jgi:hypothetical protein
MHENRILRSLERIEADLTKVREKVAAIDTRLDHVDVNAANVLPLIQHQERHTGHIKGLWTVVVLLCANVTREFFI